MNSEARTEARSIFSEIDPNVMARRRKWRMTKDVTAKYGIAVGGISVILAIVLIFFYLLYVVFPMFLPAEMEKEHAYSLPGSGQTLMLAMEEQNEIGARFAGDGNIYFFNTKTGQAEKTVTLPLAGGSKITDFVNVDDVAGLVAYAQEDGHVLLAKHEYKVTYPQGTQRKITPVVTYPLGASPVDIGKHGIVQAGARSNEEGVVFVTRHADGSLHLTAFDREVNMITEEVEINRAASVDFKSGLADVEHILITPDLRHLLLASADGRFELFDIREKAAPQRIQDGRLIADNHRLTSLTFLLGGISVLAGDDHGRISQWFPVRNEDGVPLLTEIRSFETDIAYVADIQSEQRRKGFAAIDDEGRLGFYHSTARSTVLEERVTQTPVTHFAMSPRSSAILLQTAEGELQFWHVDNEHPEVSWSVLWDKVWYESYEEPEYIWQSSAATQDFEPKYSLMPLTFGTLKAAFYAMLFAMPLAIMGAIYTAYFMSPRLRTMVKPTIELMEALPTVILGFLAGLWLAPLVEANLPGVFSLLILLPLAFIIMAFAWFNLPDRIRFLVPDGWQPLLLIPVVIAVIWLSFAISPALEDMLFGGDMRIWLGEELGLDFDQRNSLIIGLAMGFAVIPSIFSIAEDAIFSVPKHLSNGSLALGATPWQTLVRVVLPTASPGIFSGTMIGLGRAVGETMIVLMATGNTAIMDINIFEGMRTLSANIAVEMPESEVGSTHYRILFLSAFVLFTFTFILNTVAEIVRQRLRMKYGNL